MNIDLRKLVLADSLKGETPEETAQLKEMLDEAKHYACSFKWCKGITEAYFAIGIGGVISLFLLHIIPSGDGVDEWIWVVVGDLPPAYLAGEDAPTAADALKDYIAAMTQWVEAAKAGRSVEDLIPVNVRPTQEMATQLGRRLDFIQQHILPRADSNMDGDER